MLTADQRKELTDRIVESVMDGLLSRQVNAHELRDRIAAVLANGEEEG